MFYSTTLIILSSILCVVSPNILKPKYYVSMQQIHDNKYNLIGSDEYIIILGD